MNEHPSDNPLESYHRLLQHKRALEEVVSIAESVERLNSGLQATYLMGRPTSELRAGALRYFGELDEATRVRPTQELSATLLELEKRLHDDVAEILRWAEENSAWSVAPEEEAVRRLDDFRRTAQTAVALRMLLRERGAHTDASLLPVQAEPLRERIRQLDAEEGRWRERIEADTVRLQGDARRLLNNEALPQAMREITEQVVGELDENLAHIRAGRSLEQLPHRLEVVEMIDAGAPAPEPAPPPDPAPAPVPPPAPEAERRGLLARLRYWLDTPWTVRWRDTAVRKKRRR